MSQQGNYIGTPEIQAAIALAKEAAKDNPKTLKAIALVENIIGTAGLFTEHVKLRFPKKKRIFRKRDRTTKRFQKQEKARKLAVNSMQIYMSLMQNEMIKAQPLPKFPKGSNQDGGIAYVGERGKEVVINKEGVIAHLPGAYQTDSFIPMHHEYEKKAGVKYSHSQLGNYPYPYPYPVDQSTCEHFFLSAEEAGSISGPRKAKCIKCGYES